MTSECENIQTLIIEKWATEQNFLCWAGSGK